ncbi:glycosyltransferase family 2 protein [Allonocardiopsis opalescens]|uniref:GT2 family glycosyltransferase n=1 Tax=Allonocardiopsis opalescens TaxID=1144618 RepID=A0A2T0Q059_9ACTN|nr:glycosyltransferase family 2 protein [Allonocardiopsis opalescens]PRX97156.1 GT2 family glycosyltransferase [Allonocardiopsis opalescens]
MDSSGQGGRQPRIRHNDYGSLQPAELGAWTPTLSVSVVIPAYGAQHKLDVTLASLASQSYPAELLDVIVVDDNSEPPLRLPEIKPERTRLITSDDGKWGSGHAFHCGVLAAEGDIVLRLDSDMLVFREHVEAQARWHHLADHLVVLGHKRMVPYTEGRPTPEEAAKAVADGAAAALFDLAESQAHWVDEHIERSDALRTSGHRSYHVYVGATGSLRRELYHEAGGMDRALLLGGDSEFGYRLAQTGAVFIPELDPRASSWHLGLTQMQQNRETGKRYREPLVNQRVPQPRWRRGAAGRQWQVPGIDAVVHAAGADAADVIATVDGLLGGAVTDVRVSLVGPWSELSDRRGDPLQDPQFDLRLLRENYRTDQRVRLVEADPGRDRAVPYRFVVPAGWVPTSGALQRLIRLADQRDLGLVQLSMASGDGRPPATARFERSMSFARAERVRDEGEDLDDVVAELFDDFLLDGTEWAFQPAAEVTGRKKELTDWQGKAAHWRGVAERHRLAARQAQLRLDYRAGYAPTRSDRLRAWTRAQWVLHGRRIALGLARRTPSWGRAMVPGGLRRRFRALTRR